MSERKTRVTLNGKDIHFGYLYADPEIPVSFEREEAEAVMGELGLPYEFREIEREKKWSSRPEKFTALVMEPGTEDARIIEPVKVTSPVNAGWPDAYPIDAEALCDRQWMVVSDGKPVDVIGYAEAAACDIREHIEAIVDGYAAGLDGEGTNTMDAFYSTLAYLLRRPEHIDDIPDFIKGERRQDVREGHIYCAGCLELRPESAFHEEQRTETNIEQTHTDAGWGDDDKFGEVTRLNTYRICDACGQESKIDSVHLSTRNEKTRWQLRQER